MVLSLAVLIVSALPAQATIFMNTDGWTEESIQNEWNGFSDRPVWVYSFTSSDDPEYPYLGVQTAFRDPSGNVIGSGWGEGYGDASAYITYYDNPDSGVEGTFGADSEHWDTGGTIDFSFFGFGVRNVASRYSYYEPRHLSIRAVKYATRDSFSAAFSVMVTASFPLNIHRGFRGSKGTKASHVLR